MKLLRLALPLASLALVLACSSSGGDSPATPAPTPEAGAPPVDAGVDAWVDPYEQAVFSAQWTKLANAPSASFGAKMDDLFFVGKKVAFAANGPGFAISKTEDGGDTWATAISKPGTYFRAVAFLDDKHGFAGNLGAGLSADISDENALYETKDGGKTWDPVTAITGPKPAGICNLYVVDAQHVIAVGRANGPAHFLASSDGGATWTSTDLGSQMRMLIDARFSSPSEGVVVGMGAGTGVCTVLRTTDGGKSFSKVFESTTKSTLCWKVHFPSDKIGYVAVQDTSSGPATFAKTTDGGATWVEKPLPVKASAKGAFPAIGIGFIDDRIGWVAPEDSKLPVYRTKDGGETWEEDPTLKAPINRFRFLDKNTGYAIGANVWKLTVPPTP